MQAPPAGPQAETAGAMQGSPLQQPAQGAGWQVQLPRSQRGPGARRGPPPQVQVALWEFGVQASARSGSQAVQAPPWAPQLASDGVLQVPPEQQPPGQVCALQPLQAP